MEIDSPRPDSVLIPAGTPAPAGSGSSSAPSGGRIPTHRVRSTFSSWVIDHNRFELKRILGKGSYGSVAEAWDHVTGKRVAVKRIPGVFDAFETAHRIYREVSGHGTAL